MKERKITGTDPSEIIVDLTSYDQNVANKFAKMFPEELTLFSEKFVESFKLYLELDQMSKGPNSNQKSYVAAYTFLMLESLYTKEHF